MAKQTKFTLEDEEKIIDFVKQNEFIYDTRNPNYRNSDMKNRMWTEFAKGIKKDGEFYV